MTDKQKELAAKHGTPEKFAIACYAAVPEFISVYEAEAAIRKYQKQWNEAGESS